MVKDNIICIKAKDTLIRAATTFREDQKAAYRRAIQKETDDKAKWVMELVLENAITAEKNHSPLCDDTGIPHVILELGRNLNINRATVEAIHQGIAMGLRTLPGRPMAVMGDEIQRIEQSAGLYEDPAALAVAPIIIDPADKNETTLHILMQGGGPEIRGKTYRVFHQHRLSVVLDEVVSWIIDGAAKLGCTPCVPAIGIGRTHYEAASLMLQAMAYGNFAIQSDIEREITERVNNSGVGSLGLGGRTTALATFLRIGPQRASGVRIVSLRLCCCMEPRVASTVFDEEG